MTREGLKHAVIVTILKVLGSSEQGEWCWRDRVDDHDYLRRGRLEEIDGFGRVLGLREERFQRAR